MKTKSKKEIDFIEEKCCYIDSQFNINVSKRQEIRRAFLHFIEDYLNSTIVIPSPPNSILA